MDMSNEAIKERLANGYKEFKTMGDKPIADVEPVGDAEHKAYVADLAAYNEGRLIGEWIDLDDKSEDEISEEIKALLEKWSKASGELREEYAVHDWESMPSSFGEYPTWSEVVAYMEAVKEHTQEVVDSALELDIPLESIQDAYCGQYDDETDYAKQYCDDTVMLSDIPDNIKMYFDYESFGRDIFINDMQGTRTFGSFHVFYTNY